MGRSWLVERRYSEFKRLHRALLHKVRTDQLNMNQQQSATHVELILISNEPQEAGLAQQAFPRKRLVFNLQPFAIRERQALFQASAVWGVHTPWRVNTKHQLISQTKPKQAYLQTVVGLGLAAISSTPTTPELGLFLEVGRYLRLLAQPSSSPFTPLPTGAGALTALSSSPLYLTPGSSSKELLVGPARVSMRDFELIKVRSLGIQFSRLFVLDRVA